MNNQILQEVKTNGACAIQGKSFHHRKTYLSNSNKINPLFSSTRKKDLKLIILSMGMKPCLMIKDFFFFFKGVKKIVQERKRERGD